MRKCENACLGVRRGANEKMRKCENACLGVRRGGNAKMPASALDEVQIIEMLVPVAIGMRQWTLDNRLKSVLCPESDVQCLESNVLCPISNISNPESHV
jgi:hypothetical protein